jgi:hypothetical protein
MLLQILNHESRLEKCRRLLCRQMAGLWKGRLMLRKGVKDLLVGIRVDLALVCVDQDVSALCCDSGFEIILANGESKISSYLYTISR